MRYITVPEPVSIESFATGKPLNIVVDGERLPDDPWTIQRYLSVFVFADPKLGDGRKSAKAVRRVHQAFKGAKTGDVVAIESEDWEKIKPVIEEPSRPQNGVLMSQLAPFMDAVVEAPEQEPHPRPVNGATKDGPKTAPDMKAEEVRPS